MNWEQLTSTYAGQTIFVTGHTGFKGSWLSMMLNELNVNLVGYSLPFPTFSFYERMKTQFDLDEHRNDIRNKSEQRNAIALSKPDLIIHLAAQSLVCVGKTNPTETYDINVMGTANVLEIATEYNIPTLVVSSDKCYRPDPRPRKVGDPLGGIDPYSASKAAVEMICMAQSAMGNTIGVARSGNAIGGGDWGRERLIPDFYRALKMASTLTIRSPHALRPWQHVIEPLWGYLILGAKLMNGERRGPWNFGPGISLSVRDVIATLSRFGPCPSIEEKENPKNENLALRLDCRRTLACLNWQNKLTPEQTISWTAIAYSNFMKTDVDVWGLMKNQLEQYAQYWERDQNETN